MTKYRLSRSQTEQTAAVSPWVKATVFICGELSVVTHSLCTLHYTHACPSFWVVSTI